MHSGFYLVSDILSTLISVGFWLMAVARVVQKGWPSWQRLMFALGVVALPLLIYSNWTDAEPMWPGFVGFGLALLIAIIYALNVAKVKRRKPDAPV